jgi:Lhr-like helicase
MALASSGPYFSVFPLIPLLLLFVFFVAPAMRRSAVRGGVGSRRRVEARASSDGGEKELLRALERHEETTAVRAALETSLSVARAEEMLAKLASGGHVEVRARAGTLAYAMHAADRREAGPKELAQAGPEPID